MFLADAGRIGTERRSGAAANIRQKPLQALDILPVDFVLADPGTRRFLRLHVGAKFTTLEATGAACPRRIWINDGTTIRALHGTTSSSAAYNAASSPGFPLSARVCQFIPNASIPAVPSRATCRRLRRRAVPAR